MLRSLRPVGAILLLGGSVFVLISWLIVAGRWDVPKALALAFVLIGLILALPYLATWTRKT